MALGHLVSTQSLGGKCLVLSYHIFRESEIIAEPDTKPCTLLEFTGTFCVYATLLT